MTPPPTLDAWIARDAIPFALDAAFDAAVDRLVAGLGDGVTVLGLGEPLHGGEEFLVLRNRLFQRLATAHGFSAIAVESSFPRGRHVADYVAGGSASFADIREAGFSHGFGRLDANRELVDWMRDYNRAPAGVSLRFYGFDSPTEMTYTDSPRELLTLVLDYLAAIGDDGPARRERIAAHLGPDAAWENPAAMMDPAQSVGLSPAATALRIETEDLLAELHLRRPGLANDDRYHVAVQYAVAARGLLTYHAALARHSDRRLADGLGMRDAMMADNLAYLADRERGRGRVLAFAHNMHLKLGPARWQLGPHDLQWWPAGAQLRALLGLAYRVIGTGVGASEGNGIGPPEPDTLEAHLTASGTARFLPTHLGRGLANDLPTRSASTRNHSYFALTADSLTDFDWLAVLPTTGYTRGGPPLPTGG